MVGFDHNTPPGSYTIRARCEESVGMVVYVQGDITAQVFPG
jgi:hypothetical protein